MPPTDVDLSDSFVAHLNEKKEQQVDVSMSLEKLITAQKKDPTLVSCFNAVQSVSDRASESPTYFIRNGLLTRRWRPQKSNEWNDV